ncbi:glutathione S-transferase, partial [Gaertneriomyces semiglobifer]
YSVFYWKVPALADCIRLLLELGGATYENTHPTVGDWPQEKETTPYGHVPVLTETRSDGTKFVLAESHAIERYLAKTFLYHGSTPHETATIEQHHESWIECLDAMRVGVFKLPTDKRPAAIKKFMEDFVPRFLKRHERMLEKKSKAGYYVSDKLTLPDLYAWVMTQFFLDFSDGSFDWSEYPNIKAVVDHVAAHPRVKDYVENRR